METGVYRACVLPRSPNVTCVCHTSPPPTRTRVQFAARLPVSWQSTPCEMRARTSSTTPKAHVGVLRRRAGATERTLRSASGLSLPSLSFVMNLKLDSLKSLASCWCTSCRTLCALVPVDKFSSPS